MRQLALELLDESMEFHSTPEPRLCRTQHPGHGVKRQQMICSDEREPSKYSHIATRWQIMKSKAEWTQGCASEQKWVTRWWLPQMSTYLCRLEMNASAAINRRSCSFSIPDSSLKQTSCTCSRNALQRPPRIKVRWKINSARHFDSHFSYFLWENSLVRTP